MNAKEEFLNEIEGKELVCAKIGVDRTNGRNIKWFVLKDNHTKEDFIEFCKNLDFEYDNGFGTQELFGLILYKDSYSDRFVYDGSEEWHNHKMPSIEDVLSYQ